ncbi:MAG TPA: diaminobutyrate acetyltransferase, partial [Acidimicrobiales bacterium]|nr:diaminobutyrate acetyltransferase [Acidimicrobiales bacterium]
MWQLAGATPALDVNASYAYVLACWQFHRTCRIAQYDDALVGFVTGHWLPDTPQRLFLWQLAVDAGHRRRGVGRALVDALVEGCRPRYVEATVTGDNEGSRRLLHSLAQRHGVPIAEGPGLGTELFPDDHPAEPLVRI